MKTIQWYSYSVTYINDIYNTDHNLLASIFFTRWMI